MKTCPRCQRTFEDTQRFCPQDGTALVAQAAPDDWGATPPPSGYEPHQSTPPPSPYNVGAAPGGGAPPPFPPPPQPSWQQPAAPRRKIWPWVLGGVAVLGLGLIAFIGLVAYVALKSSDTNTNTSVNTNTDSPVVSTANTESYVNSRANAKGQAAQHYVDFSFRYPDTWELDPDPAPSYVRVERTDAAGVPTENFSVGWFSTTVPAAGNNNLLSRAVNGLSSQVAGNFPGYTKVSEGPTTFGRYSGYELRFQGSAPAGPYWGRVVVLPGQNGGKDGVSIIMVATGHASGVKSMSDLGVNGELPVIINTFRLGPSAGQ